MKDLSTGAPCEWELDEEQSFSCLLKMRFHSADRYVELGSSFHHKGPTHEKVCADGGCRSRDHQLHGT